MRYQQKIFSIVLVVSLLFGIFSSAFLASADSLNNEQTFVMLNDCEAKGNLRSFGTTVLEDKIVYEGEHSFGSLANGNDTWIIRSDGKGVLGSFDASAFYQNGGIRFMIYVTDITKMGASYKLALFSAGTNLSQFWNNENGTKTNTADVGYVWSGDIIKNQITKNGWNEVVLPFASAQEDKYVNGDVVTHPYSAGVNLTEIYFRNYTRTSDVYIDSIMAVSSCNGFEKKQVDGVKLSSLDINSSRYVEGNGALFLKETTEKSVKFDEVNLSPYKDYYLQMNLFVNDVASLPSSGSISLQTSEELLASKYSTQVIDDESYFNAPSMFCASRTFGQAKFGNYSYKATTGVDNHDYWMIRTTLKNNVDISELTQNGTSGTLRFWIYLDDVSNLGDWVSGNVGPQVQFGDDWDKNVYVWNNWHNQIKGTGWNEIVLDFNKAGKTGTPNPASMKYLFIRTGNATAKITAYIDNIHVSANKSVKEFDISKIANIVDNGWNQIALKISEDLGAVDTFTAKANIGVYNNVWIDSLCVMKYAGNDFCLDSVQINEPVDNIGEVSDLTYTILNSCESNNGFVGTVSSAEKSVDGTKSLFSDKANKYILNSNANAPLKSFVPSSDKSMLLYLYIDGEVSNIGDNISVFVTDSNNKISAVENGTANGYKWSGEKILSQCIYSNNWNEIVLPFSNAEVKGNVNDLNLTDIYFSSDNRSVSVYTDMITLVNNHSFTKNPTAFKQDTLYTIVDSFEKIGNYENAYHGAYSLKLSNGEEYSSDCSIDDFSLYENGGISFMLYSDGDDYIPSGSIQFAGKTWVLSDCVATSDIKCGWNKIYLSFESGSGNLSTSNVILRVSANSDLIIDELILLSGYGKTAKDIRIDTVTGDANCDQIFNLLDLVRLKKSIAANVPFDLSAADFNGNGEGDSFDLIEMVKALLGIAISTTPTTPEYTGVLFNNSSVVAISDVVTYGAIGDGVTDDTDAFKEAIRVAENYGGTVYVPHGEYLISENLTIPKGIMLVGEIRNNGSMPLIKVAVPTVSEGNNEPFISLEKGSAVQGLKIWYVNQNLEDGKAKEYPYTLKMKGKQSVTISDIELVNSYNGIDLSLPDHNLEVVRNVRATILNNGMLWDGNNDIARFENIVFSPYVWLESNVKTVPDKDILISFAQKNVVGVHSQSIDWHFVSDLTISDCNIGVLVDGGFGKFYKTVLNNCNIGVLFNKVAQYGTTFTDCKIEASHGNKPLAISLGENTKGGISFVNCNLYSAGNCAIGNYGSTALTLTDCAVKTDEDADYVIINDNGRLAANNTSFLGGSQVVKSEKGNTVSFASCDFDKKPSPDFTGCTVTDVEGDDANAPEISSDIYAQKATPNQKTVVNASSFSVSISDNDIASELQAAIDSVAATGGTVYVPKGNYRLQSPIVLRSGVTLLGSYDAPHYSNVLCTTFVTDYGKNNTNGTALITMESGSVLRGLSIDYSETRLDRTPYAYTIRGNGSDIYIRNVSVDGAYRVLDLSANRCDNHYVEYLLFSAFDTGISVGAGSENGIIRDCQSNPAQLWDNPVTDRTYWTTTKGSTEVIASQIQTFKGYVVSDTVNEIMFMNFVFGANVGVWLKDNADAIVIGQGVDYSHNAVKLSDNATATFTDSQLSCTTDGSVALITDNGYSGSADMYNMTAWAVTDNAVTVSGGDVSIIGGVFYQCSSSAIKANDGNVVICGVSLNNYNDHTYQILDGVDSFRAFGNLYQSGLNVYKVNDNAIFGGDFIGQ